MIPDSAEFGTVPLEFPHKYGLWDSDFIGRNPEAKTQKERDGLRLRLRMALRTSHTFGQYEAKIRPVTQDATRRIDELQEEAGQLTEGTDEKKAKRAEIYELRRFLRFIDERVTPGQQRKYERIKELTRKAPARQRQAEQPEEIETLEGEVVSDDESKGSPIEPRPEEIVVEPRKELMIPTESPIDAWERDIAGTLKLMLYLLEELKNRKNLKRVEWLKYSDSYAILKSNIARIRLNPPYRLRVSDEDAEMINRISEGLSSIKDLLDLREPKFESTAHLDTATAKDWLANPNLLPDSAKTLKYNLEREGGYRDKVIQMRNAPIGDWTVREQNIDTLRREIEADAQDLQIDIDALKTDTGNAENVRKSKVLFKLFIDANRRQMPDGTFRIPPHEWNVNQLQNVLKELEKELWEYRLSQEFSAIKEEVENYQPAVWESDNPHEALNYFLDRVKELGDFNDKIEQIEQRVKLMELGPFRSYIENSFIPMLKGDFKPVVGEKDGQVEYRRLPGTLLARREALFEFFKASSQGIPHAEIILGGGKLQFQKIRELTANFRQGQGDPLTQYQEASSLLQDSRDFFSELRTLFPFPSLETPEYDRNEDGSIKIDKETGKPISLNEKATTDKNTGEILGTFIEDKYVWFVDQNYFQPLEEIEENLFSERAKFKGDAQLAIKYFTELEDFHHLNLTEESWMMQEPEVLGRAIWDFQVYHLVAMSKGEQPYIDGMKPLAAQLETLHGFDKPSMVGLITSFKATANKFRQWGGEKNIEKANKIEQIAGQLFNDCAVIGKIFEMALHLHRGNRSLDELKKVVSAYVIDEDDLQRLFRVGLGYMNGNSLRENERGVLNELSYGDRIGRAWQLMDAMCGPTTHETAIFSDGIEEGDIRFLRRAPEINPNSFFPEDRDNANRSDSIMVRRWLIRIIAAEAETPPWMNVTDEFPANIPAKRREAAKNYVNWRLVGDPSRYKGDGNYDDILTNPERGWSIESPHPDSFLKQYRNHGGSGQSRNTPWFADPDNLAQYKGEENQELREKLRKQWSDWTLAQKAGYEAEMLAYNLYVACLDDGRASGVQMLKDEARVGGENYAVVNTSSAPDGVNMLDRVEVTAEYRNKLWTKSGGDGAGGPRISIGMFYRLLAPLTEAKTYVRPFEIVTDPVTGKERVEYGELIGKTLGEELWACRDGEFSTVNYKNYISGPADKQTYQLTEEMAFDLYQKIISRLGINWTQITSHLAGSEATPTFDFAALDKLMTLSRQANYLLVRDTQKEVFSWSTVESWEHFDEREKFVEQQKIKDPENFLLNIFAIFNKGRDETTDPKDPTKKVEYVINIKTSESRRLKKARNPKEKDEKPGPDDMTEKDFLDYIKANQSPSLAYLPFTGKKQKDTHGRAGSDAEAEGYARYMSTFQDFVRLPNFLPNGVKQNEFERVLLKGLEEGEDGADDEYLFRKKAFIGQVLINDMSVAALTGISYDDVEAIVEFLSKEKWSFLHENILSKTADFIAQVSHREYNGLGIFTEKEAMAILRTAGVNTGILARYQAGVERISAITK